MDFQDFETLFNKYGKELPSGCRNATNSNRFGLIKNKPVGPKPTLYIYAEVETGGASGGGWRDEDDASDYSTNNNIDDTGCQDLDSLFGEICPDITFLKYKNLLKRIGWNKDSYSVNEYYGNHTDYDVKFISAKELYDVLNVEGIIS